MKNTNEKQQEQQKGVLLRENGQQGEGDIEKEAKQSTKRQVQEKTKNIGEIWEIWLSL